MLKCISLLVLVAISGVAGEDITQQDQIYVISGVLGGVCLLLTIAVVVNTINVIRLQTKVAVLQATSTASSRTVVEAPRVDRTQQARREERNRYPPMEEPYNHTSHVENYRMESRPVPPPRPQRTGPSYY